VPTRTSSRATCKTAREATTQFGLVAAGLGVALLPAPLECVRLPRVRYLALADEGAHFSLAVANADRAADVLVGRFLDLLTDVAGGPASERSAEASPEVVQAARTRPRPD
jgi:DNA-binding transcriptional LysR family regulator